MTDTAQADLLRFIFSGNAYGEVYVAGDPSFDDDGLVVSFHKLQAGFMPVAVQVSGKWHFYPD